MAWATSECKKNVGAFRSIKHLFAFVCFGFLIFFQPTIYQTAVASLVETLRSINVFLSISFIQLSALSEPKLVWETLRFEPSKWPPCNQFYSEIIARQAVNWHYIWRFKNDYLANCQNKKCLLWKFSRILTVFTCRNYIFKLIIIFQKSKK